MFIHRVVGNETTRQIAEMYGTTTREVIRLNELETEDQLVPGVHLLVPGEPYLSIPYTIRAGDTPQSIAANTGLPREYIERWTGTYQNQGGRLTPGTTLYIPQPIRAKKAIETNAFILPRGDVSDARLVRDIRDLTYLNVFSFQINQDGTLQSPNDRYVLQAARQLRIRPMLTLTNFDGERFDTTVLSQLFTTDAFRQRVIQAVIQTARERGYQGVTIDLENMRAADRDAFTRFVREVAEACRQQRLATAVVLAPRASNQITGTPVDALDYRAIAVEVDFVLLMTYEWGWAGGPPQAVAPYPRVEETIRYAASVMPANKIMMGLVLYGYDWRTRGATGGPEPGASIGNNSAQNLAITLKTPVSFEARSATPFYRYTIDSEEHEVWFEDALSTAVKLNLVYQYQLRGVSCWSLPHSSPQTWYLLSDTFVIRKGQ